jgi:hypothetical protein
MHTPWVAGHGKDGLTGPNTPSVPTLREFFDRDDYLEDKMTYNEWCNHVPISMGMDTIGIAVGPNREKTAMIFAASQDLLYACKAILTATDEKEMNFALHLVQKAVSKAEAKYDAG